MPMNFKGFGKDFARLTNRDSAAMESKRARIERKRDGIKHMYSHATEFVTLHRWVSPPFDWAKLAGAPRPVAVPLEESREAEVLAALEAHQPSLLARITGRASRERAELQDVLVAAREADAQELAELTAAAEAQWREEFELAQRVLAGEPEALLAAVDLLDPFGDLPKLGKGVRLEAPQPFTIAAELDVHIPDTIPRELPRLEETGRVTTQTMTDVQFLASYREHVCSAVLRIARELFALTPVETVLVTARGELPDETTGVTSEGVLVSVRFPRKEFLRLVAGALNALAVVRSFEHRMQFDRSRRFRPVEPLTPRMSA